MENEKVAAEKKRKKRKGKSGRIVIVFIVVLAALLGGFFLYKKKTSSQKSQGDQSVSTATVKRTDITSELTASSSLSPKDTYEVTSLVEGEVIEANFEEGDVVEKGQVLYRIDASSIDSDLSSAQTSLQRAKESVQTAQSAYAGETARIAGNTYRSTASGYIKTLYIKEGDKVNSGTKIADLYDDSVMKITAPFLSGEAAEINVGDEAAVILEDTGEQISGTVTVVSSMEETLSGGRLVKNVTVEVSNPGGLTTDTAASVTVDGFVCSAEGTFKAKTETTLSVELSGNKSLEIENLLIHEGSYVDKNSDLFQVTAKTAEEYLKEFKDAVESADDNLENAENKLDNTQDSVDDYTITAPISGTVITKNAKVGDKISKNSSGTTTMASVVPPLNAPISSAVKKITGKKPFLVGSGMKTGLNIKMDNPKTVGGDRIVAAVAANAKYKGPIIIADMGTATTLDVVDHDGNYIGGVILPGVKVALNSLVSNTAQLPRISFDVPKRTIGKNTIECMRNGIMLGNAAMLDGLIDRMTAELGEPATLIATGGMARFITPLCTHKITYDPDLLLRGLMILYRQNTETKDA